MAPNIYWVGAGKGGVGKSTVSMALLVYLLSKGAPCCSWSRTPATRTSTRRIGRPSRVS